MAFFNVDGIVKSFGGLQALNNISFELEKGAIIGIIGPNGAGKSTLFSTISGFYRPDKGAIHFKGRRIDGLKPHQVCKLGLARTFQIAQPFLGFTPYETMLTSALNFLPMRKARKKADEVLEMVGLADKADDDGASLTPPDQKAMELGKVIATGSELILLDEVMAGLTAPEAKVMMSIVKRLCDKGISFMMVEHVMYIIMQLCPRIVVLNFGVKIAEGTPEDIAKDKNVIESYLGKEVDLAI